MLILTPNYYLCDLEEKHWIKWYDMKKNKGIYPFVFLKEDCKREYCNTLHLVIKSKNNNEIFGFIKGYFPKNMNIIFWLQVFIIDKKFMGMGVGSEVYKFFEKYLKKQYNIKKIMLTVIEENNRGINFWKKNKFNSVSDLSFFSNVCKEENVLLFQKNLEILKKS